MKNGTMFLATMFLLVAAATAMAQPGSFGFGEWGGTRNPGSGNYLGQYSINRYAPNSTGNSYGAGSPYRADSINNSYGRYGSPYSSYSATNPYATNAPKLYDSEGNYRGKLSSNRYDSESISNPYGRYGSPYSSDSINNPYGAGSRYLMDSPNNPYGRGLSIYGQD